MNVSGQERAALHAVPMPQARSAPHQPPGSGLSPEVPEPRLSLVFPLPPRQPARHTVLELWHLLSLDAPCVAATWTLFLGWATGVKLSVLDPIAMFLAVWMLYATDRLLDARTLLSDPQAPDLEERHHFHHRHRRYFLPALVASTLPLLWLLHSLDPRVLHLYTLLVVLLAGWLLLVHGQDAPGALGRRLPKEVAVGVFFAAAVFVATVARVPGLRLPLLRDAFLFGGVCAMNCLLLYAWEHPSDRSRAHASTGFALKHLRSLALLLLGWSAYLMFSATAISRQGHGTMPRSFAHPLAIPACCALSLALLLGLHRTRARLAPVSLRALADLVLLSPLIPLAMAMVGLLR